MVAGKELPMFYVLVVVGGTARAESIHNYIGRRERSIIIIVP